MDNINYLLFICVAVPILLMLFVLEKKSKITAGYMLIGILVCLFISEINGFLLELFNHDTYYVTTTITPVTEEIIKALPVMYFAFLFSDKRETLISLSIATGVGFAILEKPFEVGVELSAKQEIMRYKIADIYAKEIKSIYEE